MSLPLRSLVSRLYPLPRPLRPRSVSSSALLINGSVTASATSTTTTTTSSSVSKPYPAPAHPPQRQSNKSLSTVPVSVGNYPPPLSPPICFRSFPPRFGEMPVGLDPKSPDNERKVKLGKTLRILQDRLPTLLQSPLPSDILSPTISLHLFPSTHPFLPVVSGRVAYIAALWTSPIAWNRMPIIGNLKLDILSARMTSEPLHFSPQRAGAFPEQLVVKWRTKSKEKEKEGKAGFKVSLPEWGDRKIGPDDEFTGLFIFEFDGQGRVISHTIEHVEQSGAWGKGVGAKVVHLTDWLLGGMKGREPQGALVQAMRQHMRQERKGRS